MPIYLFVLLMKCDIWGLVLGDFNCSLYRPIFSYATFIEFLINFIGRHSAL